MTVLLILVNMLVFWGPQRTEEKGARPRRRLLHRQPLARH